jgi:hypothetical protein
LQKHAWRGPAQALRHPQKVRADFQPDNGHRNFGVRRIRLGRKDALGGKPLTAMRTAASQHFAAILSGQTGTEAMAALADDLRRLICALHGAALQQSLD